MSNRPELKIIANNIEALLKQNKIADTRTLLAEKSGIRYTSLVSVFSGNTDWGILKLLDICNTMGLDPNTVLKGTYKPSEISSKKAKKSRFLISCVSIGNMSFCKIIDTKTNNEDTFMLDFSIACSDNSIAVVDNLVKSCSAKIPEFIPSQASLFISAQAYEFSEQRKKLAAYGSKVFSDFIIQADWEVNYQSFFEGRNGICVIIDTGVSIIYSTNKGITLQKIDGLGFPIADEGGSLWLGFKAIRHAINAKYNPEKSSYLSDKILSMVNSDLDVLSELVANRPQETYLKCSKILMELLFHKGVSYEILKEGHEIIQNKLDSIDLKINTELPIVMCGELGDLYKDFMDNERLIKTDNTSHNKLLDFGIKILQKNINR